MFHASFLESLPLPAFFVVATISLALALEIGFKIGAWRRRRVASEKESPVGAVVAATLGLVGFILGMTFSFAIAQFGARQDAFLGELNAISTTYLRADFLPQPQRDQSKEALRDYVDVRAPAAQQQIANAITMSEELHTRLWAILTSLTPTQLNAMSVTLYTQSLNEVIDLHEQRVMTGVRLRIPQTLWIVLISISALGMGEIGYQTALAGSARSPVSIGLVIAFALLLYLIADLDRPHSGTLRINQSAMRELGLKLRLAAPS
jgi:hypothetical protein